MLQITIPPIEDLYNPANDEFITLKGQTLQLEHSLVSISKWESKWHKPFLGKEEKSFEETIDYIRCMTITKNVDYEIFKFLPVSVIEQINSYIEDSMTATWFREESSRNNGEVITSEIIYYWMISLNIPFECQRWHLNRLLTLIRVCNAKNAPAKKMSKRDIHAQYKAINDARRKATGSKG